MLRPKTDDDLFKDSTMTFGQHLEELRVCLFKAVVGLAIGCVAGLVLGGYVVDFIQTPLRAGLEDYYRKQAQTRSVNENELAKIRAAGYTAPEDIERFQKIIGAGTVTYEVVYVDPKGVPGQSSSSEVKTADSPDGPAQLKPMVIFRTLADDPRTRIKSLNAQEAFMIYMKASLIVGLVLSGPWVFYQIWAFVAAGLYPHEKRYVHLFLPISIVLFLAGVAVTFAFVFGAALNFLFSFNASMGIEPDPRINEWMGFVLLMPLGFGVSFQLPLVMLFMERIGLFTTKSYVDNWRIALLIIFIVGMVLTPGGDPYGMLIMAGGMSLLYLGGIALCRYLPKGRSAAV